MPLTRFLYFAAVLWLAGCSRQPAVVSAQNPGPEPVQRTAAPQSTPASPYDNPVPYAAQPDPLAAQPDTEPSPAAEAPATEPAGYSAPFIPAGTNLHVRLDESLGTEWDHAGARFYATLSQPVVHEERIVLPEGTRFVGHVTESKPSGRLKGRAVLALRLDGLDWRGRTYPVATSSFAIASHGRKGHDFRWIGGGGGVGAMIGAVAGGGEGALIGAAAGAGAGTAGALVSHRKQVGLRAETRIVFRLLRPMS
jgi:hypothetical protein